MTKLGFLLSLKDRLSGLPQNEVEERLSFYSEMIEDRIEEGLSEEDAVSAVGSVDEIAAQILADVPRTENVVENCRSKKRLNVWEIVLLVLGFPVWFPLLIAGIAVIFSLYVSLWSVIISFWAVFASFVGCAIAGIIGGIGFALWSSRLTGIAIIAAGIVLTGLSIFLFYGCKAATGGTLLLTKRIGRSIRNLFLRREERNV